MRSSRNFPLYLLFACVLLLVSCSGAAQPKDAAPHAADEKSAEQCEGIFLFGPSRYVISLVAEEVIVLDPARYLIPVYCTAEQARRAAEDAHSSGKAPASMELRVYQLEGEWRDMVRKDGDRHFLNKPAAIINFFE